MDPYAACRNSGYTFADTRAPYHAQYPLIFRLVNATGVPVFRTRHVAGEREGQAPPLQTDGCASFRAECVSLRLVYGRGIASPGDMLRSGIGTLVSRIGLSTSPGRDGASNPSVSKYPCKASPLVHTPSRAAMYSI
jgi:hypothetical protein